MARELDPFSRELQQIHAGRRLAQSPALSPRQREQREECKEAERRGAEERANAGTVSRLARP
jgi:hypothetical protein